MTIALFTDCINNNTSISMRVHSIHAAPMVYQTIPIVLAYTGKDNEFVEGGKGGEGRWGREGGEGTEGRWGREDGEATWERGRVGEREGGEGGR